MSSAAQGAGTGPAPTAADLRTAARVMRWLGDAEAVDPDDVGMTGHLAWVCNTEADRIEARP